MARSPDKIQLKKRAYHHGNLRAAGMAAALKLVAKRGPSGFTLAEAARMAGVVPSALYRHFADREALLAAVARQGFEMLLAGLPSANATGSDPREALMAFGIAYFRFATRHSAHFQVMFGAEIDKRKFPDLLAATRRTLDIFTQTAQAFGSDWKNLAAAAWSIMHGASLLTLDGSFERTDLCNQPEELLRASLFSLADWRITRSSHST